MRAGEATGSAGQEPPAGATTAACGRNAALRLGSLDLASPPLRSGSSIVGGGGKGISTGFQTAAEPRQRFHSSGSPGRSRPVLDGGPEPDRPVAIGPRRPCRGPARLARRPRPSRPDPRTAVRLHLHRPAARASGRPDRATRHRRLAFSVRGHAVGAARGATFSYSRTSGQRDGKRRRRRIPRWRVDFPAGFRGKRLGVGRVLWRIARAPARAGPGTASAAVAPAPKRSPGSRLTVRRRARNRPRRPIPSAPAGRGRASASRRDIR